MYKILPFIFFFNIQQFKENVYKIKAVFFKLEKCKTKTIVGGDFYHIDKLSINNYINLVKNLHFVFIINPKSKNKPQLIYVGFFSGL